MPRDIAGNYTLPAGNPVVPNTIIATNWANTTMQDIADALSASLSIDGSVTTAKIADDAVTPPKLAGLDVNGLVARISATEFEGRTLTAPAAGITVTNGDGVAGNPTLALANDLAALEGLGATGIAVRTAADTWAQRTITGTANQIDVVNGSGAAGNPVLSLSANLNITGPNIRLIGNGTGAANLASLGFYESNGTTRTGFVGDGGATESDIYLASDSGNIRMFPAGGAVVPHASSTYDMGSSALTWQHVYAEGIQFPATQVASADANNLDDYEEGTWTPTISAGTPGNLAVVYVTRTGTYVKIGAVVSIGCVIQTSTFTHTTATGNLIITALPFAAGTTAYGGLARFDTITTTGTALQTVPVVTELQFSEVSYTGAAAILQITDHTSGNNTIVRFQTTYHV